MGRFLGVDFGRRRIGLAVSDPTGSIAQGIDTVVVTGLEDSLRQIKRVIEQYDVERVVLGRPLNMNGTEGPAAKEVSSFGKRLSNIVSVEVVEWDERLTSVAAQRSRRGLPPRRRRIKAEVDRAAATLLLQSYLDHQRRST